MAASYYIGLVVLPIVLLYVLKLVVTIIRSVIHYNATKHVYKDLPRYNGMMPFLKLFENSVYNKEILL